MEEKLEQFMGLVSEKLDNFERKLNNGLAKLQLAGRTEEVTLAISQLEVVDVGTVSALETISVDFLAKLQERQLSIDRVKKAKALHNYKTEGKAPQNNKTESSLVERNQASCMTTKPPHADTFLYCGKCKKEFEGDCPVHGPYIYIQDKKIYMEGEELLVCYGDQYARELSLIRDNTMLFRFEYMCDQQACGSAFNESGDLKRHMRIYQERKNVSYFPTDYSLVIHNEHKRSVDCTNVSMFPKARTCVRANELRYDRYPV
ncbi:hypothetical protein DPMN_152763 [Dreissena polymorpha]|uniref:C2H2-type domain-containing protein n=1 Tax=Dreissena polymorpha TaxID=45954 RepID=A0A9D4J886_DREPO|nr:hypothetical protein DPMN_152763 [Dreissena polymorpha]